MKKNKPHDASEVVKEIDAWIDSQPGKEHYYFNIEDTDKPLTIEVHKGMTYGELRKAMRDAYYKRERENAKKILLPR